MYGNELYMHAMQQFDSKEKLKGIVEVDETYVGASQETSSLILV